MAGLRAHSKTVGRRVFTTAELKQLAEAVLSFDNFFIPKNNN